MDKIRKEGLYLKYLKKGHLYKDIDAPCKNAPNLIKE